MPDKTAYDYRKWLENPKNQDVKGCAEEVLKKELGNKEISILMDISEFLSAEVICQLILYCRDRATARTPKLFLTLKQVEREAEIWVDAGITTVDAAEEYRRQYAQRVALFPAYADALSLSLKQLTPIEERYIHQWIQEGFTPSMVENAMRIARDQCPLQSSQKDIAYCSGVLKNWNDLGIHSPEELLRWDANCKKQRREARTGERR